MAFSSIFRNTIASPGVWRNLTLFTPDMPVETSPVDAIILLTPALIEPVPPARILRTRNKMTTTKNVVVIVKYQSPGPQGIQGCRGVENNRSKKPNMYWKNVSIYSGWANCNWYHLIVCRLVFASRVLYFSFLVRLFWFVSRTCH